MLFPFSFWRAFSFIYRWLFFNSIDIFFYYSLKWNKFTWHFLELTPLRLSVRIFSMLNQALYYLKNIFLDYVYNLVHWKCFSDSFYTHIISPLPVLYTFIIVYFAYFFICFKLKDTWRVLLIEIYTHTYIHTHIQYYVFWGT